MKLFNTCSIVLLGAAAVHAADNTGAGATGPSTASTPITAEAAGAPTPITADATGASDSTLWQMAGPLLSCGKNIGQDWLMNLGIGKALGCMKGGVRKAGGALRGVKKVAQYPKSAVCMAGLTAVPILMKRGHGDAVVAKITQTITELFGAQGPFSKLNKAASKTPAVSGDKAASKTPASKTPANTSTLTQPEVAVCPKPAVVQQTQRQEEGASQNVDEEAANIEGTEEGSHQESQEQDSQQEEGDAPVNAPASTTSKKSKGCFSCCAAA